MNQIDLSGRTAGVTGGARGGVPGLLEAPDPLARLTPFFPPAFGFPAIIVAFLGRLHPLGVLLASLLIALSYIGGELAQIELRLPLGGTGGV